MYVLIQVLISDYEGEAGVMSASLKMGCTHVIHHASRPGHTTCDGRSRTPLLRRSDLCHALVYGALSVVSSPLFFIHSRLTEPACGACKPEILAPVVPGLVPGRFFGHGVFLVYHRDRLGVTSHTGPL